MHLRVAPSDHGTRLIGPRSPRFPRGRAMLLVAAGACVLMTACRPSSEPRPDVRFEWSVVPAPARVGPATLAVTVRDADGNPETGATLRVDAQMSHPGMAAESFTLKELGGGRYAATVQFTMPGDWMFLVQGSLSNGTAVEHRIDVPRVRPA